jgi:alcohol dehydrogenase class IV
MDFPSKLLLPRKTIFAEGSSLKIAEEVLFFGKRGLLVHGGSLRKNKNKERILEQFPPPAKVETFCRQKGEPTLSEIAGVIQQARAIEAEWIAGVGGGSVLDLAKAAAGLYNATERPQYYQEGGRLKERGVPFVAVPTTCGTGSEVTINSVIINEEKRIKRSLRDESFLARTVILDVGLLAGIPTEVLSYAAMDCLIQAYESFISKNATWLSETLAAKAIKLVNDNVLAARQAAEKTSLSSLLLASYLCGIALSVSRLGVIHGIAHPLGVLYNAPHGLVCSVCFIPSIKLNLQAIGRKYERLSALVGMDFLERVQVLLDSLAIQSPFKGEAVVDEENIIEETLNSGSTAANPKPIVREDVEFILQSIF